MALTDPAGKKFVMENDMRTADLWVALSSNGTSEQAATGGYTRGKLPGGANQRTVSNAAQLSLAASQLPWTVYTPNASGAADSTHSALYDAATGGNRLTDWTALSGDDVAAPG